ncbi:MAG: N-acetylmuramoyl-L-alanine amidase [Elusimicrobia bacterium]|nr:N-acetylmuramoyl-L-alanine amidase [Elusimicrobiota bacterium]
MRVLVKLLLLAALLASAAQAAEPRVIAIDAGHGGKDRGAVVRRIEENAVTLAIANKIASEFRRHEGFSPYLTRWEDVFVPLSERVDRAEQVGGKAFISIHADKADGRKPKGVIVWFYGANKRIPKGPPREPNERLRPAPPKDVIVQSRFLAERVQNSLRKRGVKLAAYADKGGFAVLKSDKMPSILIEVGNMRDPGEWALMQDPAFQDKLAKAVVQGVAAYLGSPVN